MSGVDSFATVVRYHDGTKHHFDRFARSLGYLDWASQPRPFRAYPPARVIPLYPAPGADAGAYTPRATAYAELFDGSGPVAPLSTALVGDLLRHSLALSAWKRYGASRWSLRVNPSSGNLHPTEAYLVCPRLSGLADTAGVYHYSPDRHALELRCAFDHERWTGTAGDGDALIVALTSIHWREAWKYGERAFRYCQHDLGHAIGALTCAAALAGWSARLLAGWPGRDIAALTGVDRDEDFVDAEREEPGCLMALAPPAVPITDDYGRPLVAVVRDGRWFGRATQLSEDHVQWTFIDEVARATEDAAHGNRRMGLHRETGTSASEFKNAGRTPAPDARAIILRRRSALGFDGRSALDRSAFYRMLDRVLPDRHGWWSALWWTPRIHLAIFVHRVSDVAPGLYLLARREAAIDRLKAACDREFLWSRAHEDIPLFCLALGDARRLAARLSCDQDIAADGFFSLGMIAEFESSLDEHGVSFYRKLFWESGVVGQALYLEAEAAGARATGIGCFYDDPVHDVLGLRGHVFQSLYHFTVGMPIEDARLTSEPGYGWEGELTPRRSTPGLWDRSASAPAAPDPSRAGAPRGSPGTAS